MDAEGLLADLIATGLDVVEEPGWKTRGSDSWAVGKPEGIIQHHTAPPNPYPIKRLYNGQIKCNMATHEDGRVFLVAYFRCNFSSGPGSSVVLNENVRRNIAPTANAKLRGLVDDAPGNKHFWNFENSHPGDGSPLPDVQFETIVESTKVVMAHFGVTAEQVISHAEWTRRKPDPKWNGDSRTAIEQVRAALRGRTEGINLESIYLKWTAADINAMSAKGLFDGDSDFWINDIGTYDHDWDHFTSVVLAANVAAPTAAGNDD